MPRDAYEVASEISHPDAILVRSAKMHEMVLADSVKAIGRAGHQAQVDDLCLAIAEDRAPMITGPSARKSVELILAIYESARTGKEVKMAEFAASAAKRPT